MTQEPKEAVPTLVVKVEEILCNLQNQNAANVPQLCAKQAKLERKPTKLWATVQRQFQGIEDFWYRRDG